MTAATAMLVTGGPVAANASKGANASEGATADAIANATAAATTSAIANATATANASAIATAAANAGAIGAAPLRVLPLGDSLTWGVGSTDSSGYRAVLRRALVTAGVDVDFVGSKRNGAGPDTEHEGHPGWRIDEVAAKAPAWVRAADPDVVLLDLGTNDYVQRYAESTAPARLAALVDRVHTLAPRARIVLAKLLVISGDSRAAGVRRLNAEIPRIAASRRHFVTVADMSRIPAVNTVDGVHPSDAGYRQMAFQWYAALRRTVRGGTGWPAMADPFPVPAVKVAVAGRQVQVRLSGRLTAADLGGQTVRLRFRAFGTSTWKGMGTARTDATGRAKFRTSATKRPGTYSAVVESGRAAGRTASARAAGK